MLKIQKNVRYIGVTDVKSKTQSEILCDVLSDTSNSKVHIGVMTSWRTITENKVPSKWDKVWLPTQDLHTPFIDSSKVFNVIHYVDYEVGGRSSGSDLIKVFNFGGKNCHGLQLDMIWPSINILEDFKTEFPEAKLILQVGRSAVSLISEGSNFLETCRRINDRLAFYGGLVDYVLVDMSGGQGIEIDLNYTRGMLDSLMDDFSDQFSFAVAGGLCHTNVHRLENLAKDFPNLSIDAQGKLRPSGNFADPLNIDLAAKYVVESSRFF